MLRISLLWSRKPLAMLPLRSLLRVLLLIPPLGLPKVNKDKPVVPEVAPEAATPEVNAEQAEALALLAASKQEAIAKIMANSEAGFTEE